MMNAPRRLRIIASAGLLATLALSPTAALADTAGASSTKLTCSDFNGGGLISWDVTVQLNPDGTAASAEQLGDAYVTGFELVSVERTDPATITITNGGHNMHFQGSALTQAGIIGTSISFSGPSTTCNADFTFPNAQSVINLEPTS